MSKIIDLDLESIILPTDILADGIDRADIYEEYVKLWQVTEYLLMRLRHSEAERFRST